MKEGGGDTVLHVYLFLYTIQQPVPRTRLGRVWGRLHRRLYSHAWLCGRFIFENEYPNLEESHPYACLLRQSCMCKRELGA